MREGVVLLHALARRPGSMAALAAWLAASGYRTLIPAYPSRRQTIAGSRALNILAGRFVLPRPNDGAVSVAAAGVAGMADCCVVACDHFTLPLNALVRSLCHEFLAEGQFRSKP